MKIKQNIKDGNSIKCSTFPLLPKVLCLALKKRKKEKKKNYFFRPYQSTKQVYLKYLLLFNVL